MSYEGFEEYLCEEGHLTTCDTMSDIPLLCEAGVNIASICGKRIVWNRSIDTTNGYDEDDMNMNKDKLEVAVGAIYQTYSSCNHMELVSDIRYKIPREQGYLIPDEEGNVYQFQENKS